MYLCSKKLVTYKEYSCFDHSDFPARSMFTFDVCWGSLGTSIFENLSSAANNTRSRLPSRLSFSFSRLWLNILLSRHYTMPLIELAKVHNVIRKKLTFSTNRFQLIEKFKYVQTFQLKRKMNESYSAWNEKRGRKTENIQQMLSITVVEQCNSKYVSISCAVQLIDFN